MNKDKLKSITNSIFNLRNAIIIGATVILSAYLYPGSSPFPPGVIVEGSATNYNQAYDMFMRVPILGLLALIFSTAYSLIFDKLDSSVKNEKDYTVIRNLAYEVNDNLTPVITKIISSINNLKTKSADNSKFIIISRFMDEIASFEEAIPTLVNNYRKGAAYLRSKGNQINSEIQALEIKLQNANGAAKEIYEKTLNEKRQTLNEQHEIQNTLDECESKLHYILSTLQKIEAITESTEIKDNISDEDTQNINQQLEVFSGSIKDVVRLMKL